MQNIETVAASDAVKPVIPMADRRPYQKFGRVHQGFTLVEAIIGITIFTIIMSALSLALSVALRSQRVSENRQSDLGAVRSIFDYVTRDVQAAFAPQHGAASIFIAGSGGGGSSSSLAASSGLLTMTTLSHPLQADDLTANEGSASGTNSPPGSSSGPTGMGVSMPQSDTTLVSYSLDTQARTLSRTVIPVPNTDLLGQNNSVPETVLSENVESVRFRFWDQTQQTWRTDWDFEQSSSSTAQQSGQTSTTASTSGTGNPATASTGAAAANGDTMLPGAVEITLVLRTSDGGTQTYISTIPIVAPQPQTNPNAQSASTSTTSSGP